MTVTLRSYGAARTVTGSRHLITTPGGRVLLDCGLFQGSRHESNERNRHVAVDADAVVLSHAHLDHSGALPGLVRSGFNGPIHATKATAMLCRAMLHDAARIAESDVRHLNKHRKKGERALEPIYTADDVDQTLDLFVGHDLDETFEPVPGVRATFREAGHIIGSAGVLLEINDGPTVYFTGDLGRRMYPILKDPAPLPEADYILSESTYGDREHENSQLAEMHLVNEIKRVIHTRGKLMIPAFSVGRTQNIVYALANHWADGTLPDIDVYVDSPLAEKATDVFVKHPECWDHETNSLVDDGGKPFYPENVRYVESANESKKLNDRKGPFIVIAGSGMCEGGRILHHFMHGLENEKNGVLFAGWCAPRTLGRRLIEGADNVRIFGRKLKVRARVSKINAYSAHADRSDLLRFLDPARARGSAIFLVHGDEDTAIRFRESLIQAGHRQVIIPEVYATYTLK